MRGVARELGWGGTPGNAKCRDSPRTAQVASTWRAFVRARQGPVSKSVNAAGTSECTRPSASAKALARTAAHRSDGHPELEPPAQPKCSPSPQPLRHASRCIPRIAWQLHALGPPRNSGRYPFAISRSPSCQIFEKLRWSRSNRMVSAREVQYRRYAVPQLLGLNPNGFAQFGRTRPSVPVRRNRRRTVPTVPVRSAAGRLSPLRAAPRPEESDAAPPRGPGDPPSFALHSKLLELAPGGGSSSGSSS